MSEWLGVNKDLVRELDAAGVRYCHWKSNMRLGRGMSGESDLDLLVSCEDRESFNRVARGLGFVALVSAPIRRLPGIEDRLGMDPATDELSHLHVHFQLVLGEKRVKLHHLPLESWLLADLRRIDGLPAPAPHKELFILYIRSILKSDPRAALRTRMGKQPHVLPDAIIEEAKWLLDASAEDDVREAAESAGMGYLAGGFSEYVGRIEGGTIGGSYVIAEKRRLLGSLRRFARYPAPVGLSRKAWFRIRYTRLSRRIAPLPKKRLAQPAPFVALVGADGSGKTSLAADIAAWLGWKVDVVSVLFGLPKHNKPLRLVRKVRYATAFLGRSFAERLGLGGVTSGVEGLLRSAEWLYVARIRLAREHKAVEAAQNGSVVVAERYPLRELASVMDLVMDGPRLSSERGDPAWAVSRERHMYGAIGAANPVFVIRTDLDTLRGRRPEDDADWHGAKAAAVATIADSGLFEVIDGNRPYNDVLSDLKKRIWAVLTDR